MTSGILTIPNEVLLKIFQYLEHHNFSSLHKCLLVNRHFCRLVVPLLWDDPLSRVYRESSRKKIIDIYLLFLNKKEQEELVELLSKNAKVLEEYKKQKPVLFCYPSYLKRYSYYVTKRVAVFKWCLKNGIESLYSEVFLIIHKMLSRVCKNIKGLNISGDQVGISSFLGLPGGWFSFSTIRILDLSFSIFSKSKKCLDISQLIREASQALKNLYVIKVYFNWMLEDYQESFQKLIDVQSELKELRLSYIRKDDLRHVYEEQIERSRPFIMPASEFQTLCKLSLCSIIFIKNDLKNLASLSNLEFLKIEGSFVDYSEKNKVTMGNYSLPKLQRLELRGNGLAINKLMIGIKYENLKNLDIIYTNSQIKNGEFNRDFFTLINCSFSNTVLSHFFISIDSADSLLISEGEKMYCVKDGQSIFIF
jgi:hypothetical protein